MPVSSGYRTFVIEQLDRVTSITEKNMFGGVGLYGDGTFFALIADDRLYFKVDDVNRPRFEAVGMEPFRPYDDERTMSYYEVPIEVLEDVDRLRTWVADALAVAHRARRRKRP